MAPIRKSPRNSKEGASPSVAPLGKSPRFPENPIITKRPSSNAPTHMLPVSKVDKNTTFYLKLVFDEVTYESNDETWFQVEYHPTFTTKDQLKVIKLKFPEWSASIKKITYLDKDRSNPDSRVKIIWDKYWEEESKVRLHPKSDDLIKKFRAEREEYERLHDWGEYWPGANRGYSRRRVLKEDFYNGKYTN